ncbi:MAG: phosphodiester glycosidase family protein [Clostridia bacterium]|nr:phosphodiester glycosidase family protein [Clostridia bacterium]
MAWKRMIIVALLCTCCFAACAETLEPLDMDSCEPGPAPQDASYISDTEYQDESISVKLYSGRYAQTDYVCAHVKISHPSQLRTATSNSSFRDTSEGTTRGRIIAEKVNAVVAINGDYFIKTDKCQVVLRQSQQVRNHADGHMDLLVIDKNGDFSALPQCTKDEYKEYMRLHEYEMYNVFCFGPVLVQDGVSVIPEDYANGYVGAKNDTQRSAIAQLGPLEYLLITCSGPQSENNKGLTIYEFAGLCEMMGKQLNENGCALAFNLDGGNSATLVFKTLDAKGNLSYAKVNCPEIERQLSDIIYFATLVK